MERYIITFVFFIYVSVLKVNGFVDYCLNNTLSSNDTYMTFSKEISSKEYAIASKFMSLHCCVRGYRSIEWFKDGRPYPWPTDVSNFILYPEAANQTIYSQSVQESDAGNYSCLVRNDTDAYVHKISFVVLDSERYTKKPLPTYQPDDQYVEIGEETRLFCEAFVGHINLVDVHSEAIWSKVRDNVTISTSPDTRVYQTMATREDGMIMGSYLMIKEVEEEDYGTYSCQISNIWFQVLEMDVQLLPKTAHDESIPRDDANKRTLLVTSIVVLFVLTIIVLYIQFGLELRVCLKDACGYRETNDGKEYDVLVCYDSADSNFVLGVMIPTLETRYNYRCCSRSVSLASHGGNWSAELMSQAQSSRRLLAVLSPALLQGKWNSDALYNILQGLLRIHSKVICVTLTPLPNSDCQKSEHKESLPVMLQAVHLVEWYGDAGKDRSHARRKFWTSLRLPLPPARPHCVSSTCANSKQDPNQITIAGSTKRKSVLTNSHESLEVLV